METTSKLMKVDAAYDVIQEAVNAVRSGNADALAAKVTFSLLKKQLDWAEKQIRDLAIESATDNNLDKEPYIIGDYKLSMRAGGGRWDFKDIPEWVLLDEQRKVLEERHKHAYRDHMKGIAAVDSQTGEILKPAAYKGNAPAIVIQKNRS